MLTGMNKEPNWEERSMLKSTGGIANYSRLRFAAILLLVAIAIALMPDGERRMPIRTAIRTWWRKDRCLPRCSRDDCRHQRRYGRAQPFPRTHGIGMRLFRRWCTVRLRWPGIGWPRLKRIMQGASSLRRFRSYMSIRRPVRIKWRNLHRRSRAGPCRLPRCRIPTSIWLRGSSR